MGLLNYSTQISVEKTTGQIIEILRKHDAAGVVLDYDTSKQVAAISFMVKTPAGERAFRLPADWRATLRVLERTAPRSYAKEDQARRVIWRTIKDWVEAQLALIETESVKMEQVFLPYMVARDGRTFYEVLASQQFLLKEG